MHIYNLDVGPIHFGGQTRHFDATEASCMAQLPATVKGRRYINEQLLHLQARLANS
jgi:hypothetical protein